MHVKQPFFLNCTVDIDMAISFRQVALWALLPLWLIIAAATAVVISAWTVLWLLLDDDRRSGPLTVLTLVGLLLGVGLSLPSPWTPWNISVMDCGVVSACTCAAVWALPRAVLPQSVAISILLVGSAYVIAKGALVSHESQPGMPMSALLILSALLPIGLAVSVARLWRRASTDTAAAACRQVLQDVVSVPFSQRNIEGLHTITFGNPSDSSPIGVVFLHGYAAGSAYFARNFDAVVSAASGSGARVFSVDWRGCGASPREPFSPRSTEAAERWFMDALERWRVSQGLDRVILLGHRCVESRPAACFDRPSLPHHPCMHSPASAVI